MNELGLDLWRASWQGGLFILAVFAVCRIFRRIPASMRYWLWWLACLQMPVRLLFFAPVALPVLPATPLSVASTTVAEPANDVADTMPAPAPDISSESAPISEPKSGEPVPPAAILMIGWGVGVATVLVLVSRRLIRTSRLLRSSQPAPAEVSDLAAELCEQLRIRAPRLREAEAAPCPLLAGWFRPTIVLPSGFADGHNHSELRMALAHELAHHKRRDLMLAAVPAITQSLFYFHPLAWLAIRESAAACEESCDVEAMRLSGGTPSAYARLLLNSARPDVSIVAMGAAFGFRLLHRRINMLSQTNILAKSGVRRGVTALLALGAICSIPWTVTAQTRPADATSTATSTDMAAAPAAPTVFISRPARHLATRRHLVKHAVKKKVAGHDATATAAGRTISFHYVSAGVTGAAPSAPATQPLVQFDNGLVSIDMQGTPLSTAIRSLCRGAHVSFSIKSTVANDLVNCSLQHVSLQTALDTILQSTRQELTYRVQDGVYMIRPANSFRGQGGGGMGGSAMPAAPGQGAGGFGGRASAKPAQSQGGGVGSTDPAAGQSGGRAGSSSSD